MSWRVLARPVGLSFIGIIMVARLAGGLAFYKSPAARPVQDNSKSPIIIPLTIRPIAISVNNAPVQGVIAVQKSYSIPIPPAAATNGTADQLFGLVNQQRSQNGLASLARDPRLDASAAAKCQDMVAKNYWAHVSPDDRQPWQFIQAQGVIYHAAGENLAAGYDTAQLIVTNWMNSPEHRSNILNPAFNSVGYAVCNSPGFVGTGGKPSVIAVQHLAQE